MGAACGAGSRLGEDRLRGCLVMPEGLATLPWLGACAERELNSPPGLGMVATPSRFTVDEDIHQHLEANRWSEAFELLLERYRDKVFRLAYGFVFGEAAAEDVAQDVFLKIWRALPGYDRRASLSTWIYTIARNTSLTAVSRRRLTVSLSDPDTQHALEQLPEFTHEPGANGAALDVDVLLRQLPEKYRRVIALFYLEQKSYEDVAALLGIPLGTVKTLIHRARKELTRIAARSISALNPTSLEVL